MTADCNAPLELRELIWQAMQSTKEQIEGTESGVTLRQRMSDTLSTVPSLEEFTAIIRKGYGGKASGMSGLTYQLMKVWPKCVIERVYNLLVHQWNWDMHKIYSR